MGDKKNLDRIKSLDALLARLDSPKEGDEVIFTLKDDSTEYRGIIKKKQNQDRAALYEIVPKTHPAPSGAIETIKFKGRVFKIGGWKPL